MEMIGTSGDRNWISRMASKPSFFGMIASQTIRLYWSLAELSDPVIAVGCQDDLMAGR